MKILVIGIDGGDEKIMRNMPMPNLHRLLDQNVCMHIEEDLWSRGWVEILSGTHGRESGAFYQKPVLDNRRISTQKFDMTDYAANPQIKPLWAELSGRGYTVGFMNVPSMFPAPEVNGFVVSGGGAGASTSGANRIPCEGCYPPHIQDLLEDSDYILDTRFVASGIRDVNTFIDRLVEMTEKRTRAFKSICAQHSYDMGFIALMAVCRIQYLAMSEINALIENLGRSRNSFQEKLLFFYKSFDKQLGELVSTLQPESLMLISDHGQSPRLFTVNLNAWLQKKGFQTPLSHNANSVNESAKYLAGYLPEGIKQVIKKLMPIVAAKVSGHNANWEKTRAFGITYVPGIYLNDEKRFGGIITTSDAYQKLLSEIIKVFNDDPENRQHGLKARSYRQEYHNATSEALLPDIWIDHDDSYFFEQQGNFITPNNNYGPIKTLEGIKKDMYTGIKGRKPLFSVSPFLADKVNPDDEKNLTLAYKLIVRGIESEAKSLPG